MTLLWIGNIIFLAVVIPVVVIILRRVIAPALEIKDYADDITEHGAQFAPHLSSLNQLATTRELVKQVNTDLERYVRALERNH
ncbi:MAG: hypothetical protein H0T15_06965 [Thermoleophilaceae bacterium]|nr:hypothetical protein [Thermoleophilaceae bacterium]